MADKHTIARPYAQAVFEIARDNGSLDVVGKALELAAALMRDGRVARFLANPTMNDEERLEFLNGLFADAGGKGGLFGGGNDHGQNFLKLLLEYDRIDVLPEIAEHFDELKDAVENTVDVVVTAAAPIGKSQQAEIVKALEKRLGRKVNLSTQIDEKLIGGAVIRAGDIVIDGSLRSRLDSLSNALVA